MNKDNIKILYVEDEQGIRDSLKGFLNYFCSELIVGCDGSEGLELYKKEKPDIVISDIKMPNMTGIEMVKEIKNIEPKQHIIFTTAHSENNFFLEAIDLQVDGYILKPIDLEKLEEKIQTITEHINLKRDYKKQQLKLMHSEKMASMGEMIGNIAHQWRQPLNVISTGITGMHIKKEMGDLSDEFFFETCNMINKNAQYLSSTIDDFRNFIKGEQKESKINLKELIQSTLSLCEANNKSHYIDVIEDLDDDITIVSYPNEIKQSLLNLLNNAKDCLSDQEEKYIFITLKKVASEVIITVKDNGGGISEDIQKKIYEPYFTTKHQSLGTGLGLYMAFEMITSSLEGKIHEENVQYQYNGKNYKGAEFTISLPLQLKER